MENLLLLSNIFFLVLFVVLFAKFVRLRKWFHEIRDEYKIYDDFKNPAIPAVSLAELDPIFKPNQWGPTLEAEVSFVGRGGMVVEGAISDSEGWILSALAKKSTNISEFGTCTGRTTYLLAKNSPDHAKVATLNLPINLKKDYNADEQDDPRDTAIALYETQFEDFFYSNTPVKSKIRQIFSDSKQFDETEFVNQCDLIFVDGSHAYSYVKSDSHKALKMVKPGGLILWHDYSHDIKGVSQALIELAKNYPLIHIKRTFFVAYRKPA